MPRKYHVTLDPEERAGLERMVHSGRCDARRLARARVLLRCDEGAAAGGGPAPTDEEVADAADVGLATVARLRERFVEEGLPAALAARPSRRAYARKLDGAAEARLIALACSRPPEGRTRWTLALLADRMVALGHAGRGLSYETVRRALKKTS